MLTPCGGGCSSFSDRKDELQAHARHDANGPAMPRTSPMLNTCRASGSDGLIAELLRFTRNPEHEARFHDRMLICDVFARTFSIWLASGTVPDDPDFAHSVITVLLKRGKGGAALDPADLSNTRGIAVGNVIPRLFELVLLARLSHWSVNQGIVSLDVQAGFTEQLSAEMHALALVETLKARHRDGKETLALFVDISGGYDNVHHAALWRILRHAGVPDALVSLLRSWWSKRTCSVRVGDRTSDPIPCTKGVPQGNVLSPLLWNIFFEPLLRRLKAECPGVEVVFRKRGAGSDGTEWALTAPDLAYADDLSALCGDRAAAQHALNIINEWAADWGIKINFKPGKTELMTFPAPAPSGA